MSPKAMLVTGATGFLGGHLAEAAVRQGHRVSTLAREGSDTGFLERQGVTVHRGDLADPAAVARAVAGAEVIVHCAAKVGDWGPVESYRQVNVNALRNLLDAARTQPLQRFVHISSLGVYAAEHHYGTDESAPLPANHVDGYTQTKVEAEQLVMQYHQEHQLPVVVLRPGFIYGPRDRTVLPQLIQNLRNRMVRYLGGSGKALNTIYVGNLVDAVFLAIEKDQAVGQIFNLTDGEYVSKKRFIESITGALNLPKPRPVPVPMWLARLIAWRLESQARKQNAAESPRLTQARLKFMGLNLDFSIDRAKRELGYAPRVPFDAAIQETMAWYREKV